jgi:uncharacterized protein (TIGR03437 family)
VYTKSATAMRNLMLVTCIFLGHLRAHTIVINPDPMNLPFGGRDGAISLVIVGDEPNIDCQVTLSARTQADDLVSVTNAGPQPAREVVLTVHALRQPQGQSESTRLSGSWRGVNMPVNACSGGPFSFVLTVTVTRTEPVINAVINGASLLPGIAPGSWITITGSNLTATTRSWNSLDFSGSNLPTQLEGVSVSVNGKDAAVYFISPGQLTALTPGDTTVGPVTVAVTGATVPVAMTFQPLEPAFFMFSSGVFANGKSVLARHADGCWIAENSDVLAPVYPVTPGASVSALCARPAASGETIGLVGTGFGQLGFDGAGNPLTAPTDRDFSDSYWPADPKADQTNSPAPMFPLLDPTAIQLWIGDEILPVFIASRTRPGIDIVWVTIPPDIIATADGVTWYDIKGSMLGNQLNTVQIPVQRPAKPPSN